MFQQIAAPASSEHNSGVLHGLSSLVVLVACLTLTGCPGGGQPSDGKGSHGQSGDSAAATGGAAKKPGSRHIGVWEGVLLKGDPPLKERIEFKSNGRFSWTGTGLVNFTGNWKVTGEDGDLIVVQVTDDLHPGDAEGYKITVKGDDEIYLEAAIIYHGTLKRQK